MAKKLTSYIPTIPGGPSFSVFPAVALMDHALGKRHLRVLGALCAHSNLDGEIDDVSQARLADMLALDVPLISRIISNPTHGRTTDRCGPGLAQLGYVKVLGQSPSRTDTTSYQLLIPTYKAGEIVRPDGTKADAGAYVSRKVSDVEHAARTAALVLKIAKSQQKAGERRTREFIAEHSDGEPDVLAQAAALDQADKAGEVLDSRPVMLGGGPGVQRSAVEAITPFVVRVGQDTFTRADVEADVMDVLNGCDVRVPVEVYAYFKIGYPSVAA